MSEKSSEQPDKARGDRFRLARKLADLTLEQVGEHFGVHKATPLRWERGVMPEKVDPQAIADLYQVRVAWLMHNEGAMKGDAASATSPASVIERGKSEPRLVVAQVDEVLSRARASEAERDAVWSRLRTVQGEDPTAEWLRGWVDGYRNGRGGKDAVVRPIMTIPPPPKRGTR